MTKYVGSLASYSARTVVAGYLLLILFGGTLLASPLAWADPEHPISFIDGVFTATSATCVTGLAVRSTGNDFSIFGQIVIMLLFQAGGLGIMTITTLATLSFGSSESIRARSVLTETLGLGGLDAWAIMRRIFAVAFLTEAAGAAILSARFAFDMPWETALYFGIFHAVSAFCNAGFGLWNDSLCRYVGDPTISLCIPALIILGGLGFPVYEDLRRNLNSPRGIRWDHFRLQTKVVVLMAGVLLVGGSLAILALEWNNTLRGLSPVGIVLATFFQSATTRTAGFNTLPVERLTEGTLFVMILLMFVGASPCSTGGGVKTSTVACLIFSSLSRLRGQNEVTVFRRTIPVDLIERAIAMTLLYLFIATVGITLLLVTESYNEAHQTANARFMDCTFEVFSALGTVGLSTGLTPTLSVAGKIIVILLMYIGRIGPITLAVFISREVRHRRLEYAKEGLLIG